MSTASSSEPRPTAPRAPGIPSWNPDVAGLAEAIERIADDACARARRRSARAAHRRARLGADRRRLRRACWRPRRSHGAGRDRQQVVQPRPAGGRPPPALRASTSSATPPSSSRGRRRRRADAGGARARRRLGPARRDRGLGFEIAAGEYVAWVEANSIEVVLCDQNYQFAELAELRRRGVRSIGRFVWEHFSAEHLAGARAAYDVVYSLTQAERERYSRLGMETPRVPWGIHPELLAVAEPAIAERADAATTLVRFVFPGGFLGHRKPLEPVIEAFSAPAASACGWSSRRRSSARGLAAAEGPRRRRAGRAPPRRPAVGRAPARRSPHATSGSRPLDGRASACRSTRRSPSGCRRSPTTTRR